ncbi:MAG TPA: ribosome maturation factor RimM [Candidatus Limnocylindrales bacterium]|nr:ribosome maturation factor RimM [Candidatus Limnocylindrales bacterium]
MTGPRSTSRSIDGGDDTLVVAQIRGAHGVRGEVRLDPRTDVGDRLISGATFDCDGIGPLTIATRRGPAEQPIVSFEGYVSRVDAMSLRDRFLRVSRDEARRAIAPGAVLWADLIGLAVETPDGVRIGTVKDLIRAGSSDVLIVDDGGKEILLPMIDSVVRAIDVSGGKIVATPLEGLV